jgi:hypothetical protein
MTSCEQQLKWNNNKIGEIKTNKRWIEKERKEREGKGCLVESCVPGILRLLAHFQFYCLLLALFLTGLMLSSLVL